MRQIFSGVLIAGVMALSSTLAFAQGTNTMPGGGAKMNDEPSANAMSSQESPAMRKTGTGKKMKMHKHHARMHHHHKKMHHMSKAMPQKTM